MKKLLPLFVLLLAVSVFGQQPTITIDVKLATPTPTPFAESPLQELQKLETKPTPMTTYKRPTNEPMWKPIVWAKDRTLWSYKTWTRGTGRDAEVWIKVTPPKPLKIAWRESLFSRRTITKYASYSLQFVTLHCGDDRYSVESVVPYDARGNPIQVPSFGSSVFRSPVIPGSVIEYTFQFFC